MAPLTAEPTEESTHQQFRIEPIGLRASVFARHCDTCGMDDIGLDITRPQPARQPETVASRFIGDRNALDHAPSLASFGAPTMQDLQQRLLVRFDLLERLAFDARNNRCDKLLRLAHLDHGDDRAILFKSGEGLARV